METYRYCQIYNKTNNRRCEINDAKNALNNIEIQKQKLNVLLNNCSHPQQKAELQAHVFTLEAEMQKLKYSLATSLAALNNETLNINNPNNNNWSLPSNFFDSGVSTVSGTTTPGIVRETGISSISSNMIPIQNTNNYNQMNQNLSQNKDEDVLSHQGSVLSLDWSVFSGNNVETPLNVLNDLNNVYNSLNYNQNIFDQFTNENNPFQQDSNTSKKLANEMEKISKIPNSNNLHAMASQAANLNQSIKEISQYRSDTLIAVQALPELFRLLNDTNLSVIINTTQILHQMSKKDATRQVIIANPLIVSKIIFLLGNAEMDSPLSLNTVGIVHNFSQHKDILLTLNNLKAPAFLLRLLKSNIDGILNYTIAALHNFLLYCDQSRLLVKQQKAVCLLIPLLKKENVKFIAIVTDCLQLLAYDCQDTRWAILASGGLFDIVNLIKTHSYEKLLYSTCRLIKVLSVCQNCKAKLIEYTAVNSLTNLLCHNSHRLLSNCLWALRNLSDTAASNPDGYEQLVDASILFIKNPEIQIAVCSAGILTNLTCNNPSNKLFAIKHGCVETILNCIPSVLENYDLLDPLICILKHVTCRNSDVDIARDKINSFNGFSIICNIIKRPYPLSIIKASLGLIRNLALSKINLNSLNSLKVPLTMQTLAINAYNKMMSISASSFSSTISESDKEKISLLKEIIEGSIGTILIFATDFFMEDHLIEKEFLSLLMKLLYFPINNDNIVRTSITLFSKIVNGFEMNLFSSKIIPTLFDFGDNSQDNYTLLVNRLKQLSSSEEVSNNASLLLLKLSDIHQLYYIKADPQFNNEVGLSSIRDINHDSILCDSTIPLFESSELSWEIAEIGKSLMEMEGFNNDDVNQQQKTDCDFF